MVRTNAQTSHSGTGDEADSNTDPNAATEPTLSLTLTLTLAPGCLSQAGGEAQLLHLNTSTARVKGEGIRMVAGQWLRGNG